MGKKAEVSKFIDRLGEVSRELPDERAGHHNQQYEMVDAVRGAFAVFFTQSASFLAHQRDMGRRQGRNNAVSIFRMEQIPSDNHIRNMLDGVPAGHFAASYEWLWSGLERAGKVATYEVLGGHLLVGIDGIQYFSSRKISCEQCSQSQVEETTHYSHRALTALVVHPEQEQVLPLMPEFIMPQDGVEKQDSEIAAAKRWIAREKLWLQEHRAILLGDDLFSHQPFCQLVEEAGLSFILVCKPSSHELLYQWIEGMERGGKLTEVRQRQWNGRHGEVWRYRYASDVPLRAGDDGMRVNWCELTVIHETEGTILYRNSFVTNLAVDETRVKAITHAGRARWKHENEGHNVLTTRGYHIKHNFGHGREHLAMVLFTLNLLAFFLHTYLLLVDTRYKKVREELVARRTFFHDIRALMRYQVFESWEALLYFMAVGLEVEPPPD
jgi:hypothetical protein